MEPKNYYIHGSSCKTNLLSHHAKVPEPIKDTISSRDIQSKLRDHNFHYVTNRSQPHNEPSNVFVKWRVWNFQKSVEVDRRVA